MCIRDHVLGSNMQWRSGFRLPGPAADSTYHCRTSCRVRFFLGLGLTDSQAGIRSARPKVNPNLKNQMNAIDDKCINVCNSLLRGELSAIETYGQAIRKYSDLPVAEKLQEFRSDHIAAAQLLAQNVREMGGQPETDSGGWGEFANLVQGAADLFGKGSAIESLQRGEEHGRSSYEDALENDDVMPSCKTMIREQLLPPTVRQIAELETLGDS